jgi:flagellar basal body-associated protein FliL
MQEENIQQKGKKTLSRFLPLLVLLVLVLIAVGLGAKVKNEKSRLIEEKSNAVIQERPPVRKDRRSMWLSRN